MNVHEYQTSLIYVKTCVGYIAEHSQVTAPDRQTTSHPLLNTVARETREVTRLVFTQVCGLEFAKCTHKIIFQKKTHYGNINRMFFFTIEQVFILKVNSVQVSP